MVQNYKECQSFLPHHSDNEPEITPNSTIVTISFGTKRTTEFKSKIDGSTTRVCLEHGDITLMSQSSQAQYTHSIIQENDCSEPRISVTLRLMSTLPPKDSNEGWGMTEIIKFTLVEVIIKLTIVKVR